MRRRSQALTLISRSWRNRAIRSRIRGSMRIGSNLNQIARWANTHKENAEALEVVADLAAIERAYEKMKRAVERASQP